MLDGPIFPNSRGEVPSKASVVQAFEGIARLTGLPVLDANGDRRFGGHSARVTGAQVLAAHGIDINKIRILARHSSDAIMRYVAEAPLSTLRADLGLPDASAIQAGVSRVISKRLKGLDDTVLDLEQRLAQCEQYVAQCRAGASSSSSHAAQVAPTKFDTDSLILNTLSQAIHKVRQQSENVTLCGWDYTQALLKQTVSTVPSVESCMWRQLCERCLPELRKEMQAECVSEQSLSD
jgi:hypothetical protein